MQILTLSIQTALSLSLFPPQTRTDPLEYLPLPNFSSKNFIPSPHTHHYNSLLLLATLVETELFIHLELKVPFISIKLATRPLRTLLGLSSRHCFVIGG
ncbi:hypothetical protein L873DRAFT_449722 [Choiromyces venosus 120613-1]|uniref:Uncharacterized protein n=1 Tax=Choiromyces venosus 120613-1 TaxID=1336337 RepID=A0A3N4JVU0_9PEZI|nr:hypothetical protein L873DRAFT_449722 [Choiromyces venosus 120613-1]